MFVYIYLVLGIFVFVEEYSLLVLHIRIYPKLRMHPLFLFFITFVTHFSRISFMHSFLHLSLWQTSNQNFLLSILVVRTCLCFIPLTYKLYSYLL